MNQICVKCAKEKDDTLYSMCKACRDKLKESHKISTEQLVESGELAVDVKNRRKLVELMLEHNFTIPARDFDKWRPTVEKTGVISGVSDGLKCVATDGLQGYFLREHREPLIGHVGHFIWDDPDVVMIPFEDEETGEITYVRQTTKSGAPPAFFRKENNKPKVKKARKKKEAITTRSAVSQVEAMIAKMKLNNNGG